MVSNLKFIIILHMSLWLCGCVTTVDFSDGRAIEHPELPTVQVFYDKQGDIYPLHLQGTGKKLTDNSDSSLICGVKGNLCGLEIPDIRQNPDYNADYSDWRQGQNSANNHIVAEVLQKLETTNNKTVVMLIHGFRVEDAHEDYGHVKQALLNNREAQNSPVFLEVHWDGRASPRSPFSALRAWPPAQWTAPAVGFRLRPILNALNSDLQRQGQDVEYLILTHSTGAVVAGALFGNPTAALPCLNNKTKADKCGPNYTAFWRSLNQIDNTNPAPKLAAMDLVMLAPATSAVTFFVGDKKELGYQGSESANLLFSHNKKDPALNKYVNLPSLLGYSGLGARLHHLERVQEGLNNANPRRANVTILEMTKDLGREHQLTEYIETSEFSKVVDLLWNSQD